MRRLPLALFATVAALVPLAACSAASYDDGKPSIAPTGSGGERHYAASGFDEVGLGAPADVEVRIGSGYSIVATGTPSAFDKLKVVLDGHGLNIETRRGTHWAAGDRMHFVVTMPRIAAANIGGSGSIAIDRAEGNRFDGNVGGSGNIDVHALHVQQAHFAIGGSGTIKAAGAADRLDVSIGGSGGVQAGPLVAQTAAISVAGSGGVHATVRRSADVSIVGSGDVTLAGGAKCNVTKMGSGSVHCS